MLTKVDLPEMTKGEWKIEKFKVDGFDISITHHGRIHPPKGEYFTWLIRGNTLVMSDTPSELLDHRTAEHYAAGSCLINGLGIGVILKAILLKPGVTAVTVVEISQDLIDLVSPYYNDPRVTYICCDALTYTPPRGKRYQMVWHDIWDNICSDNLPAMTKLHRKYGRRTDWQGSWCKEECLAQRRTCCY